jgi:hypothetical protein
MILEFCEHFSIGAASTRLRLRSGVLKWSQNEEDPAHSGEKIRQWLNVTYPTVSTTRLGLD